MRNIIISLLLCATGAIAAGVSPVPRLDALGQIETGDNDLAVGDAGEVSRYQIKPWIWRQYSDSEAYSNRHVSRRVAEQHLAELAAIFRKCTRREPTDFDLYVLWNAGPTYYNRIKFARSRVHPVIRERAARYSNLCQALNARLATTAPPVVAGTPPPKRDTSRTTLRVEPESLSPLLPAAQTTSVQNPMFSFLPLPAQPEPPSSGQQPLFAIGGLQVK